MEKEEKRGNMVAKVVFTFLPQESSTMQELAELGKDVKVVFENCGSSEEKIIAAASDADGVVARGVQPITKNVLSKLTKCKIVASIGIGYDTFDVQAATEHGICISNNPYGTLDAVSDHAMGLMFACARQIPQLDKAVKAGDWQASMQQGTQRGRLIEKIRPHMIRLRGKTLGLIGFGNIARALVPKAKGFGMRIIAYDPYVASALAETFGVEMVDMDRLLRESDFVSVHTSLTSETRHLLGLEHFKKMKPTAYFINTARGAIVDEKALCSALSEGYIAGAGLDVTEVEPLPLDSPLLAMDNVILTPHTATASERSGAEIFYWPMGECLRVIGGQWPRALVNPGVKEKFNARWGQSTH